jgi:transcriptional regulator with XRE-family HTH domain
MDELKAFMDRHKLTQRELGNAVGITGAFVGQLLAGQSQPSLETAKALLAFCQSKEPGMTFEKLFATKAA